MKEGERKEGNKWNREECVVYYCTVRRLRLDYFMLNPHWGKGGEGPTYSLPNRSNGEEVNRIGDEEERGMGKE